MHGPGHQRRLTIPHLLLRSEAGLSVSLMILVNDDFLSIPRISATVTGTDLHVELIGRVLEFFGGQPSFGSSHSGMFLADRGRYKQLDTFVAFP